jgi:RND family efflux transporter MFP subunit
MSSVGTGVALLLDAASCPSDPRGTFDRSGSNDSMEDLKKDLASLRLDDEPPRSRRGPWVVIAVLVLMVAASTIFWWGHVVFAATEVETTTPRVLRSGGAVSGAPVLTASGYVVARRKAVVSAKIQGLLADLRVEEGARVREGEVIARLESQEYEAQVGRAQAQVQQATAQIASGRAAIRRAEADLDEARRQLGVNERLSEEQILATDTLEASRSRVRVLEAASGQADADVTRMEAAHTQALADQRFAEAQLANTVIRAPFTGVVVKKMAEVGESVAPIPPGVNLSTSSGAIVALADLDTLEVEVDVAEANVAKLHPSQPAEVTVEAFPEKKYRAELRQITPTADRTKATVTVRVTILDRDLNLKPEMSAKATFLEPTPPPGTTNAAPAQPQILVPSQAVIIRDGGPKVFEVRDGRARLLSVSTGARRQDQVVVTSGLGGTETLIVNPPPDLSHGSKVTVKR